MAGEFAARAVGLIFKRGYNILYFIIQESAEICFEKYYYLQYFIFITTYCDSKPAFSRSCIGMYLLPFFSQRPKCGTGDQYDYAK